ncbi:MAG: HNH endonuclease domain-containing protein [Candidatus Hodarchaeales archaeon]|jgi:CRISPR/Cas system Type II protein with McrA/HNH and RuvC-like nuclease domain
MTKSYVAIKKNRYERLKASGLCACCGKRSCKTVLCNNCRSVIKARVEKLKKQGFCIECGKQESLKNHNKCYKCYFVDITKRLGGRNKQLASKLQNKFEQQNAKCFYSEKMLILGDNASVEHVLPRSRGGDNNIDNLVWVDKNINFMKHNLTHAEFIGFCKFIINKFGEDNGK